MFILTVSVQAAETSIDLRLLGYPSPPCDYMFQDYGGYPKRHVQFLDSQHLLVSFAVRKGETCQNAAMPPPVIHSAVLNVSGAVVSSLDWSRPEIDNVQAGPDRLILELVSTGIRVVDRSFHFLQEIELPKEHFPRTIRPSFPAIQLAPSRHGFAAISREFIGVGFKGYSAYFEGGPPMRQTISQSTDDVIVGDSVMVPVSYPRGFAGPRSIELAGRRYSCSKPYWIAILSEDRPICLTSEFRLTEMTAGGGQTLFVDVHRMAPGWNSRFEYLLGNADSHRILLFSNGCRFPVTDAWGFGCYFKVAVVDLNSNKVIFQEGYPDKSDVAMSPDGRLVAVVARSRRRLTLYPIP